MVSHLGLDALRPVVPWPGIGQPNLVVDSCQFVSGDLKDFLTCFKISYHIVHFQYAADVTEFHRQSSTVSPIRSL